MQTEMKAIQSTLKKEGYDPGKIDGIGGRSTAVALEKYMADLGLNFTVTATRTQLTCVGPVRRVSTLPSDWSRGLTKTEIKELEQVHPDMVKVVMRVKETCPVPFGVFDGIRTAVDQNALFKRKASQKDGYNNISKHQKQPDGYGHAVDLVPLVNGEWDWDWDIIYVIADHFQMAAEEFGVQIRWGGCWTVINGLNGSPENWVAAYVKRKLAAGQRAFNDGPHFELFGY